VRRRGDEERERVAGALTGPYALAALLLALAGVAKLRSPHAADRALRTAGLPARPGLIRAFAAAEVGLGGWCLLAPSPGAAAALAGTYAGFAALALLLARRASSCGCFGDAGAPASVLQSVLSLLLALGALAAIRWTPHGIAWVLDRSPSFVAVMVVGTAGLAYGTVLAYTELPQAWRAWSVR
jgi:hypothetical protein